MLINVSEKFSELNRKINEFYMEDGDMKLKFMRETLAASSCFLFDHVDRAEDRQEYERAAEILEGYAVDPDLGDICEKRKKERTCGPN